MVIKAPMELTLLDDVLARVVLDRKAACQHLLRIILGNDKLVVVSVKTQFSVSQIDKRGIIADVVAQDEHGRKFVIEIQRNDTHNHARRVRFYADRVDGHSLDQGAEFNDLPELYIIYISEKDIWGHGKTTYTVKKVFEETGTEYDDGVHIIYVNVAVNDGSLVAQLMQYVRTCDPDDMSQGALSEAVRYYKLDEGGSKMLKDYSLQLFEAGEAQGMAKGEAKGKAEGERSKLLTLVRNAMRNSKLTLEAAMDMLGVSEAERTFCIAQLAPAA